jgi:hypothetical protein
MSKAQSGKSRPSRLRAMDVDTAEAATPELLRIT